VPVGDSNVPLEARHKMERAVTALFVPGNRPDRFDKALGAKPDVIIIDWEDAVGSDEKNEARSQTLQWSLSHPKAQDRVVIRINPVGTDEFSSDMEAITSLIKAKVNPIPAILVAKAESGPSLEKLVKLCDRRVIVCALIESAAGLNAVSEIASVSGVERLAFGALDFSLDTGMDPGPDVMAYARQRLVLASRVAGIQAPLDSPETSIVDTESIYLSAVTAKRFGMTGKLCIHPNQIQYVKKGFRSSPEQIAWARSVIGAGNDASQIDGKMVDRPVIERARKILESLEEPR